MPPIGQAATSADATLASMARAISAVNTTTLDFKIQALRHDRSADPVQRMQSEAIVALYEVVRQIQQAMAPPPLLPPGTIEAVRAAAAAQAGDATMRARRP